MRAVTLAPLLAGIGYALPQAAPSCYTTTEQVIEPTTTATYPSTYVTTITATTPQDQGTFTTFVRVSSTKTLGTITQTENDCTVTARPTATVYTTHDDGNTARSPSIYARQDDESECTVTVKSTTTYGQTYTFLPASETSTFTQYTAYTHADATSTQSGFTAYAIATSLTTAQGTCGSTSTTTQDARCAPSALISAAGASETSAQYGLSWAQLTESGATYSTNTTDASSCCQLCAEAEKCAASAWDIRTGDCRLGFPVDYKSGELSCGTGLQAYYGAGPAHPMEPGTGLYIAQVCGDATFTNAKPDDGT